MFKKICKNIIIPIFVLSMLGCSGASSVDTGLQPVETIVLDDEFTAIISIDRGDVFALDMINPVTKGYQITGAFFDPDMLMMERFITYDDDGESRALYLFTGLGEGSSDVLVKMTLLTGGDAVVYKEVTVRIGRGDGWFD